MKYEEIIKHLYSLARPYNKNLETAYKNFKIKIEEQKKSLEQNIEKYIQKINTDLTEHRCFVQELISKLCNDINNLKTNNGKLSEFTQYDKKEKLIKHQTQFEQTHTTHFEKIFETHEKYKKCLESCYSDIILELYNLIRELRFYKLWINYSISRLHNVELMMNNKFDINHILNVLEKVKFYVDKFNNHLSSVKKLQKIGEHISAMKFNLSEVKDQVEEKAKNYINRIAEITINHSEVETSINKIKGMNKVVIGKLQIAKHTIDFYNTLKEETSKLNGVTFNDYDFTLYLTVKQKVASFESAIKPKLCNVVKQIKEIKKEIQKDSKNVNNCDTKELKEDDNDPLSNVKPCIESSLGEMKKFIDNSLKEIEMIKHILSVIQDIKNDSPDISEIKSKVCEINQLKGVTRTLTDAVKELDKFVKLQESTKSEIDKFKNYEKFTSLGRCSNELDDIINGSKRLIGLINYYTDYLTTVGYVDSLITWIKKCYSSRFETIKTLIGTVNDYVKEIIGRLETINCNLCNLKCDLERCCTSYIINNKNNNRSSDNGNVVSNSVNNYSLWKLKDYMTYLKPYLSNIRNNFNVICGVIDQIRKDISNFGRYKREIERLEKYIQCYIKWIRCEINKNVLKEGVVYYLESIKDKLNDTISIMIVIDKFKCLRCINEIKCRLESVEYCVSELECAIEGVGRNLIGCSPQSLGIHVITGSNCVNHNRDNNNNRKVNGKVNKNKILLIIKE